LMVDINEGNHDESRDKTVINECFQRKAELKKGAECKKTAYHFNQRITERYGSAAMATSSFEPQIAQDGNVIIEFYRPAAVRAYRARRI